MKVLEVRDEATLENMRLAWNELLRNSDANTVFLTWEWVTAWWKAYGSPGELRILAAFGDDGTMAGLAPLRTHRLRRYGQTVDAVSLIGDGSFDSDYLDVAAARGRELEVFEAFRPYLTEQIERGSVLLLNEVPENSAYLRAWKAAADQAGWHWDGTDVPCAAMSLPDTWDEYLRTLKPRFRTKVRSVLRNLESRPEVRFGFCRDIAEVEQILPVLFDLHTRRWEQAGKAGVFRPSSKRTFYTGLSPLLTERDWLRVSFLEWNGRVIACEYGFIYNSTYFHLQEGYEPAAEHWSIGTGLRAWAIRRFIEDGLTDYDFLGGVGRHKTDWGAETKLSKRVQIAHISAKNVLFCRGPHWETQAREAVNKAMPKRLLRARQELRHGVHTGPHPPKRPGTTSGRDIATNLYFHMGLPRLVKNVRERGQLAITPNARWPKLSWHARREPAARILYYHRINDKRDPFCPALSAAAFERQIQFLSRYYRVVSMTALLEHLQSGRPGNVVAVTFDDGYADNYHVAFPILQKYAIPATVFITTGGIDSGEPLWFERLAVAIKNTSKEWLDLEIDVPQRFWLRNETERLGANGNVFGLLRTLSDGTRREWLDRILLQLECRLDERPDPGMLSWDQIRRMQSGSVTFGGHTVTHPFASKLTQEQMSWEVFECKRRIEEEVQTPVEYFAYPNGRGEDFAEWNKEALRAAGYRAAVTTLWGLNYRSTDAMELRRGQPWEENAAAFACKFDWYDLTNN